MIKREDSRKKCQGKSVPIEKFENKAEVEVSMLLTSIFFNLEYAFILSYGGKFRLVVYHRGQVVNNILYRTLKGARVAFSKMYMYRIDDVTRAILKAKKRAPVIWTPFYEPEERWLAQFKGLTVEDLFHV